MADTLLEPRFFNKLAALIAIETTEGEDAEPTPAEGVVFSNVTFKPMVAQRVQRNLVLPFQGNQGVILTNLNATIEFDIEIAGSGEAGTPPKWGAVPRISGFAETVAPDVSVVYNRIEDGRESGSIYFVMDKVKHVLLGARGTLTHNWASSQIPHLHATITGLLGKITDDVNPVVAQTGWLAPLPVSKANTQMTLHGWDAVAESLTVDIGNTVTPRFLIGDERVLISNYSASGTAVVQATDLATIDWFAKAKSRERGGLSITHGTEPGNIFKLDCPSVEIGEPTPGNTDNIVNYSLALDICTVAGPDDITITLT